MRAYLFYIMLQITTNAKSCHWHQELKIGITLAVLCSLIFGASCNHTPAPEKTRLSDELYENLLIAFTAQDYGRVKEGIQTINEAEIEDKRILYLEAMLALIDRDQAKAVLKLKAALACDPEYSEAHNTLGTIYLQEQNFSAAETELLEAAGNPLYQTPEKAYHNLGKLYQIQNKEEQALNCYLKALKFKQDYFPSRYELSRLYFDNKKLDLAALEIEKAKKLSPDHPGVWLQIGKIEKARQNPKAAIAAFQKTIKLQPQGNFADQARRELGLLTEPTK